MKDALSRIYFDDLPVRLLGDESRPPLDRIVRAGGKVPGQVDVVVLTAPGDRKGHVLAPGEIIDRTVEPAKPIYLRSVPKPRLGPEPRPGAAPKADGDAVISQLGRDPLDRQAGRDARMRRRDEEQASAEAEAHQRQEEDREQDGVLQDEQEDVEQAQDDEASRA